MLTGEGSESRDAKQISYLDKEIRQYRRVRPPGDEDELEHLRQMLLSARHLSILFSNRFQSRDGSDQTSGDERLSFAHHAHQFRYRIQRLMRGDNYGDFIPTETPISGDRIDWINLFLMCRRLRFRKSAVPAHWTRRQSDFAAMRATLSNAWQWGRYDEDLPDPDNVPEYQRQQVIARRRTKELLRRIREPLDLLLSNPRVHFSASYGNFLMSSLVCLRREISDIGQSDADVFCNNGPDSRFGYEMGTFLVQRLLEEEEDEYDLVDPIDQIAQHEAESIWPREIALVCLEAKDQRAPNPLPAEYSDLSDSVRRLQVIIHGGSRHPTSFGEIGELWNEYTTISNGGGLVPDSGNGAIKPLFFHMILIIRRLRSSWYGGEARQAFPNSLSHRFPPDSPRHAPSFSSSSGDSSSSSDNGSQPRRPVYGRETHAWTEDMRWMDDVQGEMFGLQEAPGPGDGSLPLDLFQEINRLLHTIVELERFDRSERDMDISMLHRLERVQIGWRQAVPEPPHSDVPEQQQRFERIVAELVRALRKSFGRYERPLEVTAVPERHGRALRVWRNDEIRVEFYLTHLEQRRPLQDGEDEEVLDELRDALGAAWSLLRNMGRNEWFIAHTELNVVRLEMLEDTLARWEQGGPRLAPGDQARVEVIVRRLIPALRQRYPRGDYPTDDPPNNT